MIGPTDAETALAFQGRVRGRVQGVWFRASTQRAARRLGLVGWVRNRSDGSVEVHAQGPEPALEQLRGWLRVGPRLARVDDLELSPVAPDASLTGFSVR